MNKNLRTNIVSLSRAAGLACVVFGLTIFGSGPEVTPVDAQQSPSGAVAGALRLAASGFGPVPTNSILPPDTLEHIATRIHQERWQMPPEDKKWPMREDEPVVDTPRLDQMWHTVEPGQTLRRLRHMYKVRTSDLRKYNPGVDLARLEPGQRILVWKRAEKPSKSYGAAHWGRLYYSEPLPDDDKYVILYPHRTFGTYYTVSETKRVLDNFYERFPDAHKLIVGDISFRTGRSIHPHKSHRTGRDIDVSYPRHEPPPNFRRFHHVRRDNLHVERTFSLIKDLLDGGYVEYIFMDRWFQRLLRQEALEQGAPKEWVDRVFQYPDWSGGTAIIRHSGGHRNHFHVRFKCQPTDRRCT